MHLKLPIQVQKSETFNHRHLILIPVNSSALLAPTYMSVKWVPMRCFLPWHQRSPRRERDTVQSWGRALPVIPAWISTKLAYRSGHWRNGCPEMMDIVVVVQLLSHVWLFCNPTDCSLPGSSVHGISQARIMVWADIPSPGDLPDSGIEPKSPASAALAGNSKSSL